MKKIYVLSLITLFFATSIFAQSAADKPAKLVETLYIMPKPVMNEKFEDEIQYFSPNIQRSMQEIYKGEQNRYTVRAVYPDYKPLESAVIQDGRFLSYLDIDKKAKVVAIG